MLIGAAKATQASPRALHRRVVRIGAFSPVLSIDVKEA
jgi:hypothetical protein